MSASGHKAWLGSGGEAHGLHRYEARAIRDLAVRHVEYGVTRVDYDALREAMLWTLEQALGGGFTPAVRDAWTACYDELAGEMKAAADI